MRPGLLFVIVFSLLPGSFNHAQVNSGASATQPPAAYVTDKNITYHEGDSLAQADDYQRSMCQLDLLRPTNRPGFATVVWFHSGGLTAGRRGFPRLRGQEIALAAVGYRLSPQARMPAFLEDAAAATAWVLKHIAEQGGDPQKVFVGGASAGAYLAAMVGMDARWLAPHGYAPQQLAGLLPVTGQMTTHFTVKKLRGDTGPDLRPLIDEYAPLYHAAKDLAPICLITGDRKIEFKNRVEENALMDVTLRNLGHPWVEFHEMGGLNHTTVSEAAGIIMRRFIKDVVRDIDNRKPLPTYPVLLADDFSGAISWRHISGRSPRQETILENNGSAQQRLVLDNAVVAHPLPFTVGTAFTASVRLLHTAYARAQWFGLFDEKLENGYVVVWDSGRAGSHDSAGLVLLRKVTRAPGAPPLEFGLFQQKEGWHNLTTPVPALRSATETKSGHRAISGPTATLTIIWSEKTGRIELRMEGQLLADAVDPGLKRFSQIVLSGNTSGIYESVAIGGIQ